MLLVIMEGLQGHQRQRVLSDLADDPLALPDTDKLALFG
jgi:hypothetical protein